MVEGRGTGQDYYCPRTEVERHTTVHILVTRSRQPAITAMSAQDGVHPQGSRRLVDGLALKAIWNADFLSRSYRVELLCRH
jgi:hypothetical protein